MGRCSATPTHSDWSGAFQQRASLYLDLNIIADHANVVRRNSHIGRRVHDVAGFQIEARTMPRAGYCGVCHLALPQRSTPVSICVVNRIVGSINIEEGDMLAAGLNLLHTRA